MKKYSSVEVGHRVYEIGVLRDMYNMMYMSFEVLLIQEETIFVRQIDFRCRFTCVIFPCNMYVNVINIVHVRFGTRSLVTY